jgi:hypothetical protein
MTFTRIRTIKGKAYLYEGTRWREGERVRSHSRCLGRVGGREKGLLAMALGLPADIDWRRTFATEPGVKYEDEMREVARQEAEKSRSASAPAAVPAVSTEPLSVPMGPDATPASQDSCHGQFDGGGPEATGCSGGESSGTAG